MKASIEDIDLLIAWEDDGPHTVLVEAKGFTGFANKPMQSKITRLAAIFPDHLARDLDLHFVMAAPKPSKGLNTLDWPGWTGQPDRRHFLAIPDPGPRYAVQRCDPTGKPTSTGHTHRRLISRTWATGAGSPVAGLAPPVP